MGDHAAMAPDRPSDRGAESPPVVRRVQAAIDGAVDRVEDAVGRVEGAVDAAVDATARRWDERPGRRVRRLRTLARQPLPMLFERHPEARNAARRELGLQTIDVEDIVGTAVGGPRQRGGDFLPLKPFRTKNWQARWQRLRSAADRLTILPPIDVLRYGDEYWVLDGHNRVAAALYGGQLAIDAMVSDVSRPGASREPQATLAPLAEDSVELRRAVGRRALDRRLAERRDEAAGTAGWQGSERRRGDRRLEDRGWDGTAADDAAEGPGAHRDEPGDAGAGGRRR